MMHTPTLSRRALMHGTAYGIGAIALAALEHNGSAAAEPAAAKERDDPLAPRRPHFAAKAKSVIYLNMTGGPSQLDLFDHRPELAKLDGRPIPPSAIAGLRFSSMTNRGGNVLASPWKFKPHGERGTMLSELLPHIGGVADEITIVRSMWTEEVNHVPAQLLMMTGSPRMGRPVMGSWVNYGLGSECDNLPGYVVLPSGIADRCGTACWSSGFLPSVYSGVQLRSTGDPVLYLSNPAGVDDRLRRASLDVLQAFNRDARGRFLDPEIDTRIAAYEMAYRMQASVPDLMDISSEPAEVHEMYGTNPGQASFANNCLLARRLVERGVRFVQLNHATFDHHGGSPGENLALDLPKVAAQVDRASAALVRDLRQRGLLDETLILWGGEFGRNPILQGRHQKDRLGRDHQGSAYSLWLAGGGIRRGADVGATNEFGTQVAADPIHPHDLQATILHLLGMDHERLTYRHQGRDYRLTDVHGKVVKKLLA